VLLKLLLNLANDSLNIDSLSIIDAKVVLIILQSSAHAVKSLSDFTTFIGHKGLREEALGASVIITTKFFSVPVENIGQMLLGFIVKDERDFCLVVLSHDHQIVLNDMVLPNLNDFLEESLRVDKLS